MFEDTRPKKLNKVFLIPTPLLVVGNSEKTFDFCLQPPWSLMKDRKCTECRFIVFFINSDIGCGTENALYLFIMA